MSHYAWIHIVHLFAAIVFVGGVFFEMLVLSALHRQVPPEVRRATDAALSRRARKVMPWVVVLLFASGLTLAWHYLAALQQPLASAFSLQLSLKIVLAFSVLLHFVIAVTKMRRGTLTAAWSRYIHVAVFCQMLLIVLLAKTMFYWAG